MSGVVSKINDYAVLNPGSNVGDVETKQNAYAVLRPGLRNDSSEIGTKQNAYAVLNPGYFTDGFVIVSKIVVYVVLDTLLVPEVWTGNFGTAGYTYPAPPGFGAWNPPST